MQAVHFLSPPGRASACFAVEAAASITDQQRTVARYTPHGLHRRILTAGTPRAAARYSLSGTNTQHVSQRFRPSGHEHQHGRGCQGRRPRGPAHAGAGGGPEGLRGQKGADRGRRVQGPGSYRRQVRQNDPEHGALRRRAPDRGPVQGGAEPAAAGRGGAPEEGPGPPRARRPGRQAREDAADCPALVRRRVRPRPASFEGFSLRASTAHTPSTRHITHRPHRRTRRRKRRRRPSGRRR